MSSAIEAVKEVVPLKQSSDVVANENALTEGNNGVVGDPRDESLRNDVYTAAANGDLERLQRLVEYEGCSLTEPDGLGYYALQWAALYNRTVAAQYIIKHGGDVHATDHYGQTALHWSAVGGAIQVAEVLLQEGAAVNAADIHGYQIAHVAAQYGQTGFLYHILSKWNADPDVPDNDGRSPLHWAAYKGFADCIRLLLFLDAHRGCQDKEGYTPLHLAANKGNLEACRVLVKHGGKLEDLMVTDNGGNTPKQLASDKNHTKVGSFLDTARRMHEEEYDNNNTFPTFRTLCISYFVQSIMLVTYIRSVIMAPHFPKLTARFGILASLGVFLASAGSLMHYRCSSKDPGYIHMNVRNPENMKDYEPLLKIVINNPTLLAGNWSKLCSTCKIIRPLRAKHCSTCNRCVEQFDHHCEIVSNCIGKKNKRDFFILLVLEASATLIAGRVTIKRILKDPMAPSSFLPRMIHVARRRTGAILFLIADFYLFICFAAYTAVQTHQISQNITMYESLKKLRYSDLKDADVLFKNPYDHGCRKNWSDFLLKGYNEDVEVSEMQMNTKLQDGDLHNLTKRNDHVAVNVDSSNTNAHDGQVHSSDCIHSNDSKSKT